MVTLSPRPTKPQRRRSIHLQFQVSSCCFNECTTNRNHERKVDQYRQHRQDPSPFGQNRGMTRRGGSLGSRLSVFPSRRQIGLRRRRAGNGTRLTTGSGCVRKRGKKTPSFLAAGRLPVVRGGGRGFAMIQIVVGIRMSVVVHVLSREFFGQTQK